jgi:hypothetical protein
MASAVVIGISPPHPAIRGLAPSEPIDAPSIAPAKLMRSEAVAIILFLSSNPLLS